MDNKKTLKEVINNSNFWETYSFYAVIAISELNKDKNGNDYLNLKLVDQEVETFARKWQVTKEDIDSLKSGKLVFVSGKWKEFRGVKQFNIEEGKVADDQSFAAKILPKPPLDIIHLKKDLISFIECIEDDDYRKIVQNILSKDVLKDFCETRAGLKIHHNVVGGLLWHTVSMLKVAKNILPIYNYLPINSSLLYAGIILHDFGKIEEIGNFFENKYSLKGKLLGHIVLASNKISEVGKDLKIDVNKIVLLQHLVLSSHGKQVNGSPREPVTLEALILSMIDNLDAKLGMLFNNLKSVDFNEWTNRFILNNDHPIRFTEFWNHHQKSNKSKKN